MSKKGKKYKSPGANKNQVNNQYDQANPNKEEFSHELGLESPSNNQKGNVGKKVTGTNFAEVMKQNFQNGKTNEESFTNMMEEIAQEVELSDGKINTDPDIAHVKKQNKQEAKSKDNNSESGFTKMVEEIADEIGLSKSDQKSSEGKSKIGAEIAEIKNKILKPFKKD